MSSWAIEPTIHAIKAPGLASPGIKDLKTMPLCQEGECAKRPSGAKVAEGKEKQATHDERKPPSLAYLPGQPL